MNGRSAGRRRQALRTRHRTEAASAGFRRSIALYVTLPDDRPFLGTCRFVTRVAKKVAKPTAADGTIDGIANRAAHSLGNRLTRRGSSYAYQSLDSVAAGCREDSPQGH